MTYVKTVLILFFIPFHAFTQDLTGVWTGFLQVGDDKLPYELVISGDKNNFTGYSLMVFTFNGVENVGVKTMEVKMKRAGMLIEDGDLIYDNYSTPPRKVKLYANLVWVGRDTNMTLVGTFATRSLDMRTAMHENSFKGLIHLEKRNSLAQTKLTDKLNEMDLMKQLSFRQPAKKKEEQNVSIIATSSKAKAKESSEKKIGSGNGVKEKQLVAIPTTPAADLSARNTAILQTVSFKSDSLKLTLYDNGEVDGDTISIVLNGTTIMAKLGLTAKGVTKSIPTAALADSSELIMYAENLGRIPPNTGLLILQDGEDRYQIRFSGDLRNNSAVLLKRKR